MSIQIKNQMRLHDIAHARAGDKGNHLNICLFAYKPEHFELLVSKVTEQQVRDWFSDRNPTKVRRYLLPRLWGMNFVLENALDGGVNESLNLDMHGKSLSFYLLAQTISC